ncbi:hypothetical protein HUG17_3158 [Dermatophagoides farinae]|uniref:Ig-like domain-containing protein n=1 Tax=Dermatophagoides farinae TaxID=6954 RepID=A0A9D4NX12_DERFA|nr:hypothetical protein HUG17_3158 [Dermatophagoides farinae]
MNSNTTTFDQQKLNNRTLYDKKTATTTTTTTTGTTFHNNNKRNNRNRKVFVKNRIKLRCIIDSNPEPYRIRWLLNHRDITLLFVSNEYQLLDKNRTLLIDGGGGGGGGGSLGRKHEGKYQCSAYNKLGRGDSSELIISVLLLTLCTRHQTESYIYATRHYFECCASATRHYFECCASATRSCFMTKMYNYERSYYWSHVRFI